MLAVVLGASMSLTSCGGDDNGSDALVLDGLWEITLIETLTEEEEPATEESEDGDGTTTDGDGTDGGGDAGAGSPPAKTEEDSQEEIKVNLGYIRFSLNTYEYFTVEDETLTTVCEGTYLLSDKTLTLTKEDSADLPVVAIIELTSNQLTMAMALEEEAQMWYAQKMANDPYKDEDTDNVGYIDFESEVHKQDSVAGSLWNPDVMHLNDTLFGILDTLISLETYKAEQFYYLKVDTAKTYQLTIKDIEADYSELPFELMKYLQIWLSFQPDEKTYLAEEDRIEEGEYEREFENLKSPTGYLYIRLFSYQDKIKYKLVLTEQTEQD